MIKEDTNINKSKLNLFQFFTKISNPKLLPKLYALPKIHQSGNNAKSIISNINLQFGQKSRQVFSHFKNLSYLVKNNINLFKQFS